MKKKISNIFLIIGLIVFVIGFYSMFIKAGLPYQDPTPDMAEKWMFYHNFGKVLIFTALSMTLAGVVMRFVNK